MRLSTPQVKNIKDSIIEFRPNAKVFLFGSRVDDEARGGDIDILVLDETILTLEEKSKILRSFWNRFGEQRVDIVCFSESSQKAFKKLALLNAIPL